MAVCIAVTKGNLGGAQRYVESLATMLVTANVPTIVVAGEGNNLLPRLRKANIDAMQIPGLGNASILADVRLLLWIAGQFRNRKIHKIVFNSTKLLPIAWLLSFFLPLQSIYYVCHGFPFIPSSTSLGSRAKKLIFYGMLRRIKSIICVSGFVKSQVEGRISPDGTSILARNTIEPSVALDLAPPTSPESSSPLTWRFKEGAPTVRVVPRVRGASFRTVSLAEINSNKGIDALCEALVPFRASLMGAFEWHIYGEGKDKALVERIIARSGLSGIVMLHGFREDARDLLRHFDALLIPSRNEAFGMVALEAAASGLYVCGLNVGGVPEAILSEDYGCTVSSAGEMASFLSSMACDGMRPFPPRPPSPEYWEQRYKEWRDIHVKALEG